jgi:DNA-binding NarL/FixJ family response regulator
LARVFIVEDHPIVRHGLAELINAQDDLEVCGQAESAPEALQLIETIRPDVALVDIALKNGDGIELIAEATRRGHGVRMVVISSHDPANYEKRATIAGAVGYVRKTDAVNKLVEAIRCVLAGRTYFSNREACP